MGLTAFPHARLAHNVPALPKQLMLFCSEAATIHASTEHTPLHQKSRGEQIICIPRTAVTTSDRL